MRSLKLMKLIVSAVVAASLVSGCVVVERPYYHHHDGYRDRYYGHRCD